MIEGPHAGLIAVPEKLVIHRKTDIVVAQPKTELEIVAQIEDVVHKRPHAAHVFVLVEAALTDISLVIIEAAAIIGLQLDVNAQHEPIPKAEEAAVVRVLDAATDPKAVELDHTGPEAGNDG